MRVLITGSSGYIGSHIQAALEKEYAVYALNRRAFESNQAVQFISMPAIDRQVIRSLIEKMKPDVIFHCLAVSKPLACEEQQDLAREVNHDFSLFLSEAAHAIGARFVFFSTDWVFDGAEAKGPFHETAVPKPLSLYSRLKFAVEEKVLERGQIVLRLALVYGLPHKEAQGGLQWMIDNFLNNRKVVVYEDEWRTPVFIDDVLYVCKKLLSTDVRGVLHVAGPERINRVQFAMHLAEALSFRKELIESCLRPIDESWKRPEDLSLSTAHTEHVLSYRFMNPSEAFFKIAELFKDDKTA